jgi:ElaB/YqjD/DUF883 family membrane-anchored ribosome-binding protein
MDRDPERETIRRLRELARQPSPSARASPDVRSASARQRLLMSAADMQLNRVVYRNPFKTIVVMAGIGFIVGYWPILARGLLVGAASTYKTVSTGRSRWHKFVKERADGCR